MPLGLIVITDRVIILPTRRVKCQDFKKRFPVDEQLITEYVKEIRSDVKQPSKHKNFHNVLSAAYDINVNWDALCWPDASKTFKWAEAQQIIKPGWIPELQTLFVVDEQEICFMQALRHKCELTGQIPNRFLNPHCRAMLQKYNCFIR